MATTGNSSLQYVSTTGVKAANGDILVFNAAQDIYLPQAVAPPPDPSHTLGDGTHTNVNSGVDTANEGQLLVFNAGTNEWEARDPVSTDHTLGEHTNVNPGVDTANNGQLLTYNSGTNEWEAQDPVAGATTASNQGIGGGQVFKQKTGNDLELRTLLQGTGTIISTNIDEVEIAVNNSSIQPEYANVQNKPATFPPDAHTHPISEVVNLQTTLDGKSNVGHTHIIADVTGLQTALDSKLETLSNIGTGSNIFKQKVGTNAEIRRLTNNNTIDLFENANDITITVNNANITPELRNVTNVTTVDELTASSTVEYSQFNSTYNPTFRLLAQDATINDATGEITLAGVTNTGTTASPSVTKRKIDSTKSALVFPADSYWRFTATGIDNTTNNGATYYAVIGDGRHNDLFGFEWAWTLSHNSSYTDSQQNFVFGSTATILQTNITSSGGGPVSQLAYTSKGWSPGQFRVIIVQVDAVARTVRTFLDVLDGTTPTFSFTQAAANNWMDGIVQFWGFNRRIDNPSQGQGLIEIAEFGAWDSFQSDTTITEMIRTLRTAYRSFSNTHSRSLILNDISNNFEPSGSFRPESGILKDRLQDLSDVAPTAPVAGQFLKRSGANRRWESSQVVRADIPDFAHNLASAFHPDVNISGPVAPSILRYNGTHWVNNNISGLAVGDGLLWNGTAFVRVGPLLAKFGEVYWTGNTTLENLGLSLVPGVPIKINAGTSIRTPLSTGEFTMPVNGRITYTGTTPITCMVSYTLAGNAGDNNRTFETDMRKNTTVIAQSRVRGVSQNDPDGADDWGGKRFLVDLVQNDFLELFVTQIHTTASTILFREFIITINSMVT